MTEALAAAGEPTDGTDAGDARGESLLLPLLQGLLGGGGERLLAGLGAAGADVVADVRRSLARLRAALAPPTDHPQARALLTLADRLEDALEAADRLDGCRRKPRRRSRAARHTVGVTHEELAQARRLVDRDHLLDADRPELLTSSSGAASTVSATSEPRTPERKPSIDENVSYHDAVASRQKPAPIQHSASFVDPPRVNRDARVERRAPAPRKPDFFRHSIADGPQPQPAPQPQQPAPRRPSDAKSGIAAIATKFDAQAREAAPAFPRRVPERRRSPPPVTAPTVTQKPVIRDEPKIRAPLYKPLPPTYNFAAPPSPADEVSKPLNRFSNNKRSRMKRANTIDIGRPLGGYKLDSDTDDDMTRGPAVPKFQPQTENDKKFVAFMRKNEENQQATVNGQSNWSSRFGNIKNAFESREQDNHSRSSSSSSARRFWRAADESPSPSAPRPRKFLADVTNSNIVKPPWTMERREQPRAHATPHVHIPPPAPLPPPVPQSPTRPVVVKPFVAKPIPVNQFSHAPMSAFKPPAKITSPTNAPSLVWSPPSIVNSVVSPTTEPPPPAYNGTMRPVVASPPVQSVPWTMAETNQPRRIVNNVPNKYQSPPPPQPIAPPAYQERPYIPNPPTPPTHAPPLVQSYPVKAIPSQNNLAAPELVRQIDDSKPYTGSAPYLPKVDAQKLQIEFYEKQIRESRNRARQEPLTNGHSEPAESKPPAPPAYTITDYTPTNTMSTFVPLQQTPDIEKARAHKVDYLPDVVMNEGDRNDFSRSPGAQPHQQNVYRPRGSPHAINAKPSPPHQNGDVSGHDEGPTTEHNSVQTRVMRGPVRGAATITAGVRTRHDDSRRGGAADNLKGVLDKFSFPKRDAGAVERKKPQTARSQVRVPVQNGPSPLPAHASPTPLSPAGGRSPALAASRESVLSSESPASAASSPLSRSGSWHQLQPADRSPKATSPRKVVARAKSMHLLAVPKLFEGGIARDELTEKKKTVEAYFSGQVVSRAPAARRARQPAQAYSLGRSRTMPTVAELQFLDESNADDAFEDLVSALA